jgi:hypothetical protein
MPSVRQQLATRLVAPVLALVSGCAGIDHTFDDLGAIHGLQTQRVVHRFDVDRYNALNAALYWGTLSGVPGVQSLAKKSEQHLDDPAGFCRDLLNDLLAYDLTDPVLTAEAVYWAGMVAEDDPFPLSRMKALQVLSTCVAGFSQDVSRSLATDTDYHQVTLTRLTEFAKLLEIPSTEALPANVKEEFQRVVQKLSETRYGQSRISRKIARNFATALEVVSDPELRGMLTTGIRTLVARAALQQLVVSLNDTHEQVRIAAAAQLVRCGGRPAIAVVIERQKEDPIPSVRASLVRLVASTLTPGQAGSDSEIEFLADRIRDPDTNVSVNAMESLGIVTGIGREFDHDWWRRWWERRLLERPDVRPETSPAPPPGGETPPRNTR